jgi:hypothetical protein
MSAARVRGPQIPLQQFVQTHSAVERSAQRLVEPLGLLGRAVGAQAARGLLHLPAQRARLSAPGEAEPRVGLDGSRQADEPVDVALQRRAIGPGDEPGRGRLALVDDVGDRRADDGDLALRRPALGGPAAAAARCDRAGDDRREGADARTPRDG